MAVRSKAEVCVCSITATVGLDPAEDMDVSLLYLLQVVKVAASVTN